LSSFFSPLAPAEELCSCELVAAPDCCTFWFCSPRCWVFCAWFDAPDCLFSCESDVEPPDVLSLRCGLPLPCSQPLA
jgi:hypothetical protein